MSSESKVPEKQADPRNPARRSFLNRVLNGAMVGGLAAAYGTLAMFAARFLYPAKGQKKGWMFVIETARLKRGDSLSYVAPDGSRIAVARQAETGSVRDFIALSSTCPHLGCQVHWEGAKNRFFCPCHNGAFDASGKAFAGPPAEMNQSLFKYPLKIENETLFIEVPLEKVAGRDGGLKIPSGPPRPVS